MGKRITHSAINKIIESQKNSGLSIDSYCKKHKISKSTFWYWRKRHSRKSQQKQGSSFIKILPVAIEQHSTIEVKIGSAVICIKEGCSETTVKMVLNAAKSIYSDTGVANHAS